MSEGSAQIVITVIISAVFFFLITAEKKKSKEKSLNEEEEKMKTETNEFKMANEYGIAGFVLALLLPLYKLVMTDYGKVGYWIYYFIILLTLFLTVKGIRKSSKKFQKGLAVVAFTIVSLTLINETVSIFFEQQPTKGTDDVTINTREF